MKLKQLLVLIILFAGIKTIPAQESGNLNSIFPSPVKGMYAEDAVAEKSQNMIMGLYLKDLSRYYYSKYGEHQLSVFIMPFDLETIQMINYLNKVAPDTLQMYEELGYKLVNYKSHKGLTYAKEDNFAFILIVDDKFGTVTIEGYSTGNNYDYISSIILQYLENLNITEIQNYTSGQMENARKSFQNLGSELGKKLEEEGF